MPPIAGTRRGRRRGGLTTDERDRYSPSRHPSAAWAAPSGCPETMAELEGYVEHMRPLMSMNEQTRQFIDFLAGDSNGPSRGNARRRLERRLGIAASMSLMPTWARHLTGTYQPALVRRAYLEPTARLQARLTRWAYPQLPCKAMATARATTTEPVAA
jgi:uncharacterized protein (DUF2236 family)